MFDNKEKHTTQLQIQKPSNQKKSAFTQRQIC